MSSNWPESGADLNAAVSLHGDLQTTMPAKKGEIKAAVFVLHGSKDPVAPKADRDALEAEMDGAGANWQLLDFGGRLHSFAEEETVRKSNLRRWASCTIACPASSRMRIGPGGWAKSPRPKMNCWRC